VNAESTCTLQNVITKFAAFLMSLRWALPDEPIHIPNGMTAENVIAFADRDSPNQNEPTVVIVLSLRSDGEVKEFRYLTGPPSVIAGFIAGQIGDGDDSWTNVLRPE
jgi:hypothetical protein